MPSLREVRQAAFPTARPLAPVQPDALDRSVAWVRLLKAHSPAFDALEAGDLALVPEAALEALAAGPVEPAALVEAMAGARAAAVLLVGEAEMAPAAALAADRARELGLPGFRLVGGDPGSLERAVIGYLVNARAELERQAARLEARLEELALAGGGPDAYAAAVAAFLGRAVALEGLRGETLAVHAPSGLPVATRAAARYLAHPQAAALRVPLAGVGSLALLGSAPPTELERVAMARVGPLLAIALGQPTGPPGDRRAARDDALPPAGPPWSVLMARQLAPEREAPRPEREVPLPEREVPLPEREALRDRLRRLAPARRLALRGDANSLELRLVVAPEPDDPLALGLAARIAATAERVVAVSRPFRVAAGRALAEQEARTALEAAEAVAGTPVLVPGGALRVVRADRLAVYRLLGDVHNLARGPADALALLAPLRRGSRPQRAERLATLRAILDHPGQAAAAAALGIHRNTLAYRVRRLEALTGWQLDEPDLRFALALAVRLVQSAQL